MTLKQKFYDSYHKKNNKFHKVITKNNFTYYQMLRFFYQEIKDKLNSDFSQLKMLDVGCGVGAMSLYFASLGINLEAIDVSKKAINIANQAKKAIGLKNIIFKNQLLSKGVGKYDIVITSEVIEHIENEKQFLTKINSQLKKSGLLFLTTPLKENLLYKLGFYNKFDKEVGHLRRYSTQEIQTLLKNNGFKILALQKVEGPLRNLLFTTKLGFIIRFIRGPLVPVFHWLDWVSMKIFGASDILILAQKKSSKVSKK